jgi:hypothetical protein
MDFELLRIIDHLGHSEHGIFGKHAGKRSGKNDVHLQRAYWYRWQQNYEYYLVSEEYKEHIKQRTFTKSSVETN